MNEYFKLTPEEREELAEALSSGEIYLFPEPEERTDEFFMHRLSSGREVSGKYQWDSDEGEFIYFEILEPEY